MDSRPTILVDSREKTAWSFSEKYQTSRVTLCTGDYSVAGLEDRVRVERKSLGDLVNTVTQDWQRFRKELYRLAGFDLALIVVEADLGDLLAKRYESNAEPISVLGRCNACLIDHGVPVVFWGQRPQCQLAVERFMGLVVKKLTQGAAA